MHELALSVVIPLYNEGESVSELYQELTAALEVLDRTYEVIVVDDGSSDDSFSHLRAIHETDPRWKIIRFRRNYGQTAALTVGFEHARGEVVITIDADLQNDPRDIADVLEKLSEGYDIVSGWRIDRQEPFFTRRLPSILANRLISRISGVWLHDYGCTLKAYRSEIVKNIYLYGELHRFIPAIASAVGARATEVPVRDRARRFGRSKYGIGRTFRVILDLILVRFLFIHGARPLLFFGGLGMALSSVGVLLGLYLTFVKLFLGEEIGERPLLLLAVLLVVLGVQFISIGLVAEVVTRVYRNTRPGPQYLTREELGFSEEPYKLIQ